MSKRDEKKIECNDSRECFGKKHTGKYCAVLRDSYPDGKCPFCKPRVDVTGKKVYPYDKFYRPG